MDSEAQQNYKVQWQRERRAERLAAGLCRDCGAEAMPQTEPDALKGVCRDCLTKYRERRQRQQQKRTAERAAQIAAEKAQEDTPFCPHCHSKDLIRGGTANGKKRFRCRTCERWSYGEHPAPPMPRPIPFPCPYCKKRCYREGRNRYGQTRFRCTACGRRTIELRPLPPRAPGGPFPFIMSLCLSYRADRALRDYCERKQLTTPQAIRQILWKTYEEPVRRCVSVGPNGLIIGKVKPESYGVTGTERLPNLVASTARARMSRTQEETYDRFRPTVLVTRSVTVALDAKARAGLIKTAWYLGINHQEAFRLIVVRECEQRSRVTVGSIR